MANRPWRKADDAPEVLDCLEYDDRLCDGDVLAGVAFLAMNLERATHGHSGGHSSDATAVVVPALWSEQAPWPTAVALDTSGDPQRALAEAIATIRGTRPAGRRDAGRSMTGAR